MSPQREFRQPKQPWDLSMWSVIAIVPLACLLAALISTRAGALTLAGYLCLAAVWRASPALPGPSVFSVRARWFDVTALGSLALAIGALGLLAPPG